MQRDTPDEVYNNITSTNQRLMREMEDYLASVDSSFSAAAPRPPPPKIINSEKLKLLNRSVWQLDKT